MKILKLVKERRGTTMVEAAVVLPLIIFSVMVIIFILVFINRQVSVQSQMHIKIWAERGNVTETVVTNHSHEGKFPIYKGSSTASKTLCYDGTVNFSKRGLLTRNYSKQLKGYIHAVREMELIRLTDLVK